MLRKRSMSPLICLMVVAVLFALSAPAGIAAGATRQPGWEKTVEAAKKEGVVVIHAGRAATVAFQAGSLQRELFPEIKLVVVPSAPDPILRITSERRAAKYLADVVMGGASTSFDLYRAKVLEPIKEAFVLPEVVTESNWWQGKHHYADPEQRYGFNFIGVAYTGIHYNSRMVDPQEIQSYQDFLNAKWKGKMQALDVRGPGGRITALRTMYLMPGLGPDYIGRLFGEMDVTLFRDHRQAVDWLVTGKYPICFNCSSSEIGRAKRQGFSIGTFESMREGVGYSTGGGSLGLVNRAPHPSAARLFINRFLSRKGQLLVQTEYAKALHAGGNSLRVDIPKEMVPKESRLVEGVHYVNTDTPESASIDPLALKIYSAALAEAEKRRTDIAR